MGPDLCVSMMYRVTFSMCMYILQMISVTLVRSNGLKGNALACSYVMTWMKNVQDGCARSTYKFIYNVQAHIYMCTCTQHCYIYVHVHAQHRLVMQEVQYMYMPYIVPLGNGLIKVSDGIVWVCACNHVCLFLEDTLNALIRQYGRKEEREKGKEEDKRE